MMGLLLLHGISQGEIWMEEQTLDVKRGVTGLDRGGNAKPTPYRKMLLVLG